ncbi:MAG: serine protease [Pseudomonadota bacterium]
MSRTFLTKLKNNVCKVTGNDKHGTGFLISDNLILTVYHIVDNCNEIKVTCLNNKIHDAELHELIDDKYKELDIALLKLPESIPYEKIDIVNHDLTANTKWISRGYPIGKQDTGDNLIDMDNYINDQFENLKKGKIDLDLHIEQKLSSYEGLSGAPLIVDENIVGIINSQLTEAGTAKELNGLSIKYFQDLLKSININVKTLDSDTSNNKIDFHSSEAWMNISPSDGLRNLKDKLKAVCQNIPDYRIEKYSRELNLGRVSLSVYNEREITSIKYIIFEACQDELMEFYETYSNKVELSLSEIKEFLEKYSNRAKKIIEDKRKDNYYPSISDDLIYKIILDLIDECYLAFDKEGIYE